ncbi:MAG: SIR2 family protein [Pseudomonadota bacterium]
MRFIADGPSIPDELLLARDQGRVVFFCGAGVSKAHAHLPDFFGLTKSVMESLGALEDSLAMELMSEAQNTTGLVSADRIFGLLERDFYRRDIYEAVAAALCIQEENEAPDEVKLRAHQAMLRLATTPHGRVQLVTTNFDRLFEMCRPELETFCPPKLPDFSLETEFNGIVYLHGKINPEGTGAEGGSFVLSSSEFGDAYLARGWATSFVKSILERYMVVFVGYSADDPPMQYLLEALNEKSSHLQHIYAFQRGNVDEARALWEHKGVTAIPFSNFDFLWDSLDLWAERAINPDAWYQGILAKAQVGPSALEPFERGQVAHIASYVEGMRKIVFAQAPLPASWLYVFDSGLRCRKEVSMAFNEQYYIDTDDTKTRAWDAFAISVSDITQMAEGNTTELTQHRSDFFQLTTLPERQQLLTKWISQVAGHPESIWWASKKLSSHVSVKKNIIKKITFNKKDVHPPVYSAWMYLLDYFEVLNQKNPVLLFKLKGELQSTGWTARGLRTYATYIRPYIEVTSPNYTEKNIESNEITLKKLISLSVTYPDISVQHIEIPNDWLALAVKEIRHNLEYAMGLEDEINSSWFAILFSLYPDKKQRFLSKRIKYILFYINKLNELSLFNSKAAQEELVSWPKNTVLFAHLRVWALGQELIVPSNNFQHFFEGISSEVFWDYSYQHDLLFSIKKRWKKLGKSDKVVIQNRLLQGLESLENNVEDRIKLERASQILNRMVWLESRECFFENTWSDKKQELMQYAPTWKSINAQTIGDGFVVRSGFVDKNESCSCLLEIPINQVLTIAKEKSNYAPSSLKENVPFCGLSKQYPFRALRALLSSTEDNIIDAWGWNIFLYSIAGSHMNSELNTRVAHIIARMPNDNFEAIFQSICDWMRNIDRDLFLKFPDIFTSLIKRLINFILECPQSAKTVVIDDDLNWIDISYNSPVGKIVNTLLETLPDKEGEFFSQEYLLLIEKMLALPDGLSYSTVACLSQKLPILFRRNAEWANNYLISTLESASISSIKAFWDGFSFRNESCSQELFLLIKPALISWARASAELIEEQEGAAQLIFWAWKYSNEHEGESLITDGELHSLLVKSSDTFRHTIIQHASCGEESDWFPICDKLFSCVWPKQISVKSSYISKSLCNIPLQSTHYFEKMVGFILPFISKVDYHNKIDIIEMSLVEQYPQAMLYLLDAVLPDDTSCWPYDMDLILETLHNTDQRMEGYHLLASLQSKWNSRRIL